MLRKVTKRITNNFGLKILAAVFAIVIWLVVVNIEDPEKTKGFVIPVTIENSDYLTDMGKTYDILNNSDKISFTVTGKRSIIEELSESDFTAVANMENINDEMTTVPVSVTASRYASQIEINKRDATLKISVENLKTERYTVQVETEGSPAAYCYIESAVADPKKITVTGPESVLSQIATVQATVDVSGAEEDIATNSKIVLLDSDGNEIPQDRLTLNRTSVAVDVTVTMGKSVPLKFVTNGTPADGYRFKEAQCSISSVNLVGSSEALAAISELEITGSQMNITGASANVAASVDLSKFLPDGVTLASDQSKQISVTLVIEGRTAKAYAVPVKNITVKNLPSNYQLEFNADTVTVNLLGFAEDFADINPDNISGTIDASAFSPGVMAAEVSIDGAYTVSETPYTSVTVTEKSENTGTTEGTGNTGGTDNSAQ